MLMAEEQLELFPNEIPICTFCKSENVKVEAWSRWNKEKGEWELEDVRDLPDSDWCNYCDSETNLTWINVI
jgi:hypothetical protein